MPINCPPMPRRPARAARYSSSGCQQRGIGIALVLVLLNLLMVLSVAGFTWFVHAKKSTRETRWVKTQHLMAQAAYALSIESSDSDGDGTVEAPAYDSSGTTMPSGGGNIPATSASPQRDGFSTRLGYCSWDNGSMTASTNRTPGDTPATDNSVVFALISAGPDRVFQTTCANARIGTAAGDDLVAYYTVAQLRNGLAGTAYYGTPVANATTLNALTTSGLQNGQLRLISGADTLSRWNSGTSTWNTLGGSASGNSPITGFKNNLINGNFDIWQRGTTITYTSQNGCWPCWTADHWRIGWNSPTVYNMTVSQQAVNLSAGDPSGTTHYLRINPTAMSGTSAIAFDQPIENVLPSSGTTYTFSFYARSSVNMNLNLSFTQKFGSGGSAQVTFATQTVLAKSSWQKFTYTLTGPSVAGQTIGTSSNLDVMMVFTPPSIPMTLDLSQMQLETGSTATAFEYRPPATELGLAERYYQASSTAGNETVNVDYLPANTSIYGAQLFHLPMRVTPTLALTPGTTTGWTTCSTGIYVCNSSVSANGFTYTMTSGGTAGYPTRDVRWTADAEINN